MSVRVLVSEYLFPYFLNCGHCHVPLQIDYARDLNISVLPTKIDGLKSVQQVPTVTCPRCKKETRLPREDWKAVLESLEADGKHKAD
ncbi:hypothetical protein COY48_03945 [Candidatus Collierbacteria bacterium CG_4_10_14_0_8_um_filter_43_86]|nr:MAG: hypothetical protein COW83_01715 [Candidatus Collierbacteria bacterium CG22_combo_CG10-13_8_21_14_all_43_12]PIZ24250.1 MAG: hypothetical protein COY48_03945 [Candidatus Collierbacteria bacterium CG_4_10_14_0_8_um_filter_43_86]